MSKKLITVFGATGNQGGSIISLWESSPELQAKYSIRAVTRDTSKPAAKALASKGVEVVAADLNDASSLKHAVTGAYGVFAVTQYWELMDINKERAQGIAISDAVFAEGVKHFIWHSLPHTTKITDGKLSHIDHFVGKAEVEEYIESKKSAAGTLASYYMPAFFMSNFNGMGLINPGPDGVLTLAMPYSASDRQPIIDIQADTGAYIWGAFEAGSEADGVQLQAVSEWTTAEQVVSTISAEADAGEVRFYQIPRDTFKGYLLPKMGELGSEEMTQNMELIGEYAYYGKGTESKQAESDKFLYKGHKKASLVEFVKKTAPWKLK